MFCWIAAAGYAFWTGLPNSFTDGKIETVGVAGLILSGGLLGISGSFFWFVSRRIDPRPEDRSDAEIAEAAGEFGFFSPGSYWPVGHRRRGRRGRRSAWRSYQVWLVLVGLLGILFTVGGLLFEYYIGGAPAAPNRSPARALIARARAPVASEPDDCPPAAGRRFAAADAAPGRPRAWPARAHESRSHRLRWNTTTTRC